MRTVSCVEPNEVYLIHNSQKTFRFVFLDMFINVKTRGDQKILRKVVVHTLDHTDCNRADEIGIKIATLPHVTTPK